MSDTTYGYHAPSMTEVVDQQKAEAAKIDQALTDMDNELRQNLVHWTSDARQDYEAAYKMCRELASRMPQALDKAGVVLQQILDEYLRAERSVSGMY